MINQLGNYGIVQFTVRERRTRPLELKKQKEKRGCWRSLNKIELELFVRGEECGGGWDALSVVEIFLHLLNFLNELR